MSEATLFMSVKMTSNLDSRNAGKYHWQDFGETYFRVMPVMQFQHIKLIN